MNETSHGVLATVNLEFWDIPLDGTTPTSTTWYGTMVATRALPTTGACFVVVGVTGADWGNSDAVCGVPGIGGVPGGSVTLAEVGDHLAESAAEVKQTLAVALPRLGLMGEYTY
jgi:hypothetical protein